MSVKIRLTRMGSTHHPFYRLVVMDSRKRRDGRAVDTLGYYNPVTQPAEVKVEGTKALTWLQRGAQPSDTARSLLKQVGVWQRFQLLKQGKSEEEVEAEVAKILETRNATAVAVAEKQAQEKAAAQGAAEKEAEEAAAAEAAEAETPAEEAPAEEAPAEEAPAEAAAEEAPAQESGEAEAGEEPKPAEGE